MDPEIRRAIKKALAYFDTFDFPLTAEEIYRWLWVYEGTMTLLDVRQALDDLVAKKEIMQKNSFYCFLGREKTIRLRQDATPLIKEKMTIARRAAKILRFVPFLRAVYVCNTVAGAIPHEKSDIDVFIVISPNRLWMTRAMITVLLSVFRMRRTAECVNNKICLSFYMTEDHLSLDTVRWGEPDIYLAYWIDQLVPVFDREVLIERIYHENTWVKRWIPHAFPHPTSHPKWQVSESKISRFFQDKIEHVLAGRSGDIIEVKAKRWQKKKMGRNIHSLQDLPDSRVVVSDTMLKFHENDRREYFRQRWRNRCFELHI